MSDEPRIAKYGMPASEGHHIVERHFVVMQERKLVEELHFQHALSVGPVLSAKLAAAAGIISNSSGAATGQQRGYS